MSPVLFAFLTILGIIAGLTILVILADRLTEWGESLSGESASQAYTFTLMLPNERGITAGLLTAVGLADVDGIVSMRRGVVYLTVVAAGQSRDHAVRATIKRLTGVAVAAVDFYQE
jgi:hypothetical protein